MQAKIIFAVLVLSQNALMLMANQCGYLIESGFENCSNKTEWDVFRDTHKVNEIDKQATENCAVVPPCRHIFRTARIYRSFQRAMSVAIPQMLTRCCGDCVKFHEKHFPSGDAGHLYRSDEFDIIYPVYSSRSVVGAEGFYFIPIYNLPNAYFITLRKTEKEVAEEVMGRLLDKWPILVVCVLMSLVAGFIIWILDTWKNESEFPRPFLSGIYEGFWWAIVSMTTVGYGDKIPKSFLARIFAVLWCIDGMLVCSIAVASVSSVIMDVTNAPVPEINGRRVGALKGRTHDLLTIAQQGGVANEVESNRTLDGMKSLLKSLETKEIDGILVGRTTYYYYLTQVKKYKSDPGVPVHVTEKSFKGEDLVAGMLVKNSTDYSYFKRYFEMNWAHIQGCFAFRNSVNRRDLKIDLEIRPLRGLFLPFLFGSLMCLAFVGCFGVVYEVYRRNKVHHHQVSK